MTIVAQVLDNIASSAAQAQADAIRASAVPTIRSGQFVYFVAFNGTNNDRHAIYKSGNPLSTNVAVLTRQIKDANTSRGKSHPPALAPDSKLWWRTLWR